MQIKNRIRRRPRHLEDNLQASCVQWFKWKYPNQLIWAVPNGGKRNLFEAVRLKKQGVLAGVPDLFIAHAAGGFHGLFIEMKVGTNKQTSEQKNVSEALSKQGYLTAICRSFEEFENVVGGYVNK